MDAADGERSVYRTFQNRFGPAEAYEEASAAESGPTANATIHDPYSDLTPYTASYEQLDPEDAGRTVVVVVFEYREAQPSLHEYITFEDP